ncbi:hypothetical protein OAH23_01160 [Verrucomicrobia bacterium]|nr:hypothetical protein [Verrucomicrobiota bacterium]
MKKSTKAKLQAYVRKGRLKASFMLLTWILLCFAALTTKAALQFDVFPGYGDYVRSYHWCPFTFELHQDGSDFNGFVSLEDSNTGVEHRVPIELPTNTRKKVVIPVFFKDGGNLDNWTAKLISENGQTIAERSQFQATEIIPWSGYLMGSVSRSFAGQPKFPEEPRQEDYRPQSGRIQTAHFPDQPLALEGLNSLYLHASRAIELEIPQSKALGAWLAQGGHLIIAMDEPAEINSTEWLSNLIPFIPDGVGSLEWDDTLEKWLRNPSEKLSPAATCDPSLINRLDQNNYRHNRNVDNRYTRLKDDKEKKDRALPVVTGTVTDGSVLAEQEGLPLIIQARRGRGQLTLLTFSPERDPIKTWKNKPWFWAKLGGIPGHWFEGGNRNFWSGQSVDGLFGSMIESRQVKKLPVGWLMAMLVVYLACIGPIDRIVLKKLNRQMWTWVTFPAYVILFSAVIYYVGFRLRAGDLEWSELHVVDIIPFDQETITRGRTYGSLYSPINANYELVSNRNQGSLRAESSANWNGSFGGQSSRILRQTKGFLAAVSVPVWTSRMFISDWYDRLEIAPIEASLKKQGTPEAAIVLQNMSPFNFSHLRLIVDNQVYTLKGFGSTKLSETSSIDLEEFLEKNSSTFSRALRSRSLALGQTYRLDDMVATSATASFVDILYKKGINNLNFNHQRNMDLTAFLEDDNAVLLAWSETAIGIPKLNQFTPNKETRRTLLRLVIPKTDSAK